jgi:Uri superfamily endonuclease
MEGGVDGPENRWMGTSAMELPEAKGTYILITSVAQARRLQVGSLGRFELIPGYYAYLGSAFGPGGLRARIAHHLASAAEPHWHVDYLLQIASPVEVWFTTGGRKLEQYWAEFLEAAPRFRVPIRRFGSSDYHRSRLSHLFYSRRRPSFRWFQHQMTAGFEGVAVEQFMVCSSSRGATAG